MNIHDGHRSRLDEKVAKYGLESLAVHEQLEYILFAVIPRGDTNRIAHDLLDRFFTITGVMNADVEELTEISGVGSRTAKFLHSLPMVLGIVEREMTREGHLELDDMEKVRNFAKSYFHGRLNEAVYVLSLTSSNRLLACTKVSDGIRGESLLTPSMVIKQAVRDNADGVIVAHNHPCGVLALSVADLTLIARLIRAFEPLDVELLDCIVVAGGECLSVRENYEWEGIKVKYKER